MCEKTECIFFNVKFEMKKVKIGSVWGPFDLGIDLEKIKMTKFMECFVLASPSI